MIPAFLGKEVDRTAFSVYNKKAVREECPVQVERRSTQVGRRGAPAKGVGRVTGARVRISPSPPKRLHNIDAARKNLDKIEVFCIFKLENSRAALMDEKARFWVFCSFELPQTEYRD